MVEAMHTGVLPVIVPGRAFTVNTDVRKQPLERVYVIFTVLADTPLITAVDAPPDTPVERMLPIAAEADSQVPPVGVDDKVVVAPTQMASVPVTAVGVSSTVTIAVSKQLLADV
jgi:hypothetical protein